jgi:hypothetical protein
MDFRTKIFNKYIEQHKSKMESYGIPDSMGKLKKNS